MIYYSIHDYISAIEKYLNTPAKIICGEGFVLCNDEWVTYQEYLSNVSRPTYSLIPKANADSTHISSETIRKKST